MTPAGRISEIAANHIRELERWLPALCDSESPRRASFATLEAAVHDSRQDLVAARGEYRQRRHETEIALGHLRDDLELSGRLLALIAQPSLAEKNDITMIQVQHSNSIAAWTASDALDRAEELVRTIPATMSLLCVAKLADLLRGQLQRLSLDKKSRATALFVALDTRTARKEIDRLTDLGARATTAVDECFRRLSDEGVMYEISGKVLGERAAVAAVSA